MRLWCPLVLLSFALPVFASPILVRWDEFALCLRKHLKRQFSPNVICATRKMASNFRRSVRCPGCEKFFHCQANYEAVFHCSQAAEAIQTAQVFSDCREYAQLGGSAAASLSDRQRANLVGRRGGDCVGEFLTKAPDFSLASVFNLGAPRKCQWNPYENTCGTAGGEVIASADYPPLPSTTARPYAHQDSPYSNSVAASSQSPFSLATLINLTQPLFNLKPTGAEKAPSLIGTLQTLNSIKNKLPQFSTDTAVEPNTKPANDEENIIAMTTPVPGEPRPPRIPIVNSDLPDQNLHTTVQDDPLFGSIASAFGSFFGKPPLIGQDENLAASAPHPPNEQRPPPILIPLNEENTYARPERGSTTATGDASRKLAHNQDGTSKQSFIFPASKRDS
ncbi:uncharacterized protein LOC108864814 [Galendromus occidentalis]|uniref:Uncharacterized protein LOC108864814 n=1 Tax=Galendromus occidentalis TaxID=34638 RepID=A0AAJ7PAH5_9ACAR|nr:uncharacterized protein LOC108864814 [Galendromus occidentalis]